MAPALCLCPFGPRQSPFNRQSEEPLAIETQSVTYRDGDTDLTGIFFSDTARPSRRPGLLVVHGGGGLDEHAKGRARGFAGSGYVVFACDMYGNGVAGSRERVMARLKELVSDPAKLCQRGLAAIRILASHPQIDTRMAAVGYCFGGMTVLELARSGAGLAGVVSVHGSLRTSRPAQPGAVKARILVCHGALDPHVPASHVAAFIEEMNQADADWQLIVYGGAMHGFTHESAPQFPGVAYHAAADARSSSSIRAFFTELFR